MAAIRFTVLQAALSAVISGALAVPIARALFRRRFPLRGWLIRLMSAPFVLPAVVAIFGLLAIFGRQGPVNTALESLGLPPFSVFGLHGVVLAHVFLNLPLTVRMVLQGWQAIPAERFRLAQSLALPCQQEFRHLEWPMLRSVLPAAVLVVFLVCLTSFAVALTLGGGPKATTLELGIYQALRFDFDLGRAALLAAVQFGLCAAVTILVLRFTLPLGFGAGQDRATPLRAPRGWRLWLDIMAISAAALFLLPPLLAVTGRGLFHLLDMPPQVWPAAVRSVLIAVLSAVLATSAALLLAVSATQKHERWLSLGATLPLATSSLVLGTGLFITLRQWVTPEQLAIPITVLVNVVLTLPYLFRLLLPEAQTLRADFGRLTESLGLPPMARLRFVVLPRLRRPLGFGTGLAAALSMGDLGVIALFAGDQGATLPLVVQRLMGAYKMDEAAAAALLLVSLSFALFALFDRLGQRHASS